MHFPHSIPFLLSFGLLASGAVIRDLGDDPESANPKTPPQSLNRPVTLKGENIYKAGFKTAPDSCTNLVKPSEQCIKDMQAQPAAAGQHAFSGGELKLDKDHKCSDSQLGQLQTAAWDALALGTYTSSEPNSQSAKDVALWKTYIGPDWPSQSKRIADNFGRVGNFMGKKQFDIYLSCSDPHNLCSIKKDGKGVGGYAYQYDGWFGYKYYYIAMCAPFFTMDSLEDKIEEIEKDLRDKNTNSATRAVWQKNTGQAFLHEMMHLNVVGQPHINDETVEPGAKENWAYGPKRVHQLARFALNQGGGATRASTNADSYAWLANSKYFYDLTGYFPAPDNYKDKTRSSPADQGNMELESFTVDFGFINEKTTDAELEDRKNKILAAFDSDAASAPDGDKPAKGKSLSIAMLTQVNSHSGGASFDAQWHFYTTATGHAVGCDSSADTQVSEISPQGPSDPKSSFEGDHKNLPWPAGTYELDIEGEKCSYKNDGKGAGRLFCPKREIGCSEDSKKSTDQGLPACGSSRVTFHPAVYCDF